jgi:hypothetical protein
MAIFSTSSIPGNGQNVTQNNAPYKATESLCLTDKGEVVPEGHADARSLLVGKGCELPYVQAKNLGLIVEEAPSEAMAEVKVEAPTEEPTPNSKAIKSAPSDKAVVGPTETK